jgi:hypothetical protein
MLHGHPDIKNVNILFKLKHAINDIKMVVITNLKFEVFVFLEYFAAVIVIWLPTFRDSLSVPS